MKTAFCILALTFSFSGLRAQQSNQPPQFQSDSAWTLVTNLGTQNEVYDVFFLNKDTGWVTGDDGLFSTVDAGAHWTLDSELTGLSAVQFVDANNGWVNAGQGDSNLKHTTNGGKTWISEKPLIPAGEQGFYFLNADTGYMCGNHDQITKTTDGGNTWVLLSDTLRYGPVVPSSAGDPYVYAVANQPSPLTNRVLTPVYSGIYSSVDAGTTWKRIVDTTLQRTLYAVYALSSSHVVIGGEGITMVTWDGGNTWAKSYDEWDAMSFSFIDSLHGWLCGDQGQGGSFPLVSRTTDGGNTWIALPNQLPYPLNEIYFTDTANGWVTTLSGLLYRTSSGGTQSVLQSKDVRNLSISNYPNPSDRNSIMIDYALPVLQHVTLQVYDMTGRLVSILLKSQLQTPGQHSIAFNTFGLSKGAYTYQLSSEVYTASGKLAIIK